MGLIEKCEIMSELILIKYNNAVSESFGSDEQ